MATLSTRATAIEFDGEVAAQRYVCRIGDALMTLTCTELEVFVDLLIARLSTHAGLSTLPSIDARNKNLKYVMIHRLRRAVDRALEPGDGNRLIVAGPRSTYALNVAPQCVSVSPKVAELAPHHLPEETVVRLLQAAAKFDSPQ